MVNSLRVSSASWRDIVVNYSRASLPVALSLERASGYRGFYRLRSAARVYLTVRWKCFSNHCPLLFLVTFRKGGGGGLEGGWWGIAGGGGGGGLQSCDSFSCISVISALILFPPFFSPDQKSHSKQRSVLVTYIFIILEIVYDLSRF